MNSFQEERPQSDQRLNPLEMSVVKISFSERFQALSIGVKNKLQQTRVVIAKRVALARKEAPDQSEQIATTQANAIAALQNLTIEQEQAEAQYSPKLNSETDSADEHSTQVKAGTSDVEKSKSSPIITENDSTLDPKITEAVEKFNSNPNPYILGNVPLDVRLPLEKVHISLGDEVDELFMRRGLDLARAIQDGKYDCVIYLDKAARPVRSLAEAAWEQGLGKNQREFPNVMFLNIGSEKTSWYKSAYSPKKPSTNEELHAQWTEGEPGIDRVAQLEDAIKNRKIPQGVKILVVDEYFNSGAAGYFTQEVFNLIRPDIQVDNFWLIQSYEDKKRMEGIYGDKNIVPWKDISYYNNHSLVIDDGGSFLSKAQYKYNQNSSENEWIARKRKQEIEYQRRLQHYFSSLYKTGTF